MTLTSTPLETLFFPIVQHAQALSKVVLINTCILLQDPGGLLHLFLVHPTRLNLPPILSAGRKSMLWTYLLTHGELVSFKPVDGADNWYGQLYKRIGSSSYKEASIKGFTPPTPFAVASHFACRGNLQDFHFPTLAELNDKFESLS